MNLEPPKGNLDTSKTYKAKIKTDKGEIIIHLYSDQTPITCENFINLANAGYYNETTFHRVIPGFMVQGGDPTGTGSGGPGYQFEDEFVSSLKTLIQKVYYLWQMLGQEQTGLNFHYTCSNTTSCMVHTLYLGSLR